MRDRRFVTIHRGGSLDLTRHRLLSIWAADCAAHVLAAFKTCSSDERPERAIEGARAWANGAISVGDARRIAVATHAAARAVKQKSAGASAAARAAGHAVATAHMADHSLGASWYALKAARALSGSSDIEQAWQIERLPDEVREWMVSALDRLPAPR